MASPYRGARLRHALSVIPGHHPQNAKPPVAKSYWLGARLRSLQGEEFSAFGVVRSVQG